MKTKFGSIIVAGSGKIGGHVASRNRSGSYLRTKVTPTNPNTTYQSAARSYVTTTSKAWAGLTLAQRESWNAAVQNYSKTDIFGDIKNPSGFNLFVKLNSNLLATGSAIITTCPALQAIAAVSTATIVADVSDASIIITLATAVPVGFNCRVRMTEPTGAGITYIKNKLRVVQFLPAGAVAAVALTTNYNAHFGSVGAAGQIIHYELDFVSTTTGQVGAKLSGKVTVQA